MFFDPAEISGLLERSTKAAPHDVPLYEAVQKHCIGLMRFGRDETASFACLCKEREKDPPVLALVSDDGEQRGPEAWPLVGGLMQWAARVVIYDGPRTAASYHDFVTIAERLERVVVVECESEYAEGWRESARGLGAVLAVPWW